MNKKLEDLKTRHESLKNEYVQYFCKQMGLDDNGSYFTGNIVCIGDYFIDMQTIVYAVNNEIKDTTFLDWYNYNLTLGEENLGDVSLENYVKGNFEYSIDEITRLQNLKDTISESKRNLEKYMINLRKKHQTYEDTTV